jgi:hypothetical protein
MDPLAWIYNWSTHEGEGGLFRLPKKTQSTLFTVCKKNKKTKKLTKLCIPFLCWAIAFFFEPTLYSQKPIYFFLNALIKSSAII